MATGNQSHFGPGIVRKLGSFWNWGFRPIVQSLSQLRRMQMGSFCAILYGRFPSFFL